MSELKKEFKALSEWVKFELEDNSLLDPPEVEFRLSPIYAFDALNSVFGEAREKIITKTILDCIQEWSLKRNGKAIPLDEGTKQRNLRPLLSAKIKGKDVMLGWEVYLYASNLDNFVKN